MTVRRALAPLLAGLLGLTGSLGVTLYLHHQASRALERVLEERLQGAGETAAAAPAAAPIVAGRTYQSGPRQVDPGEQVKLPPTL